MTKTWETKGLDQIGPARNHAAIRDVFVERLALAARTAGRRKSIKERQEASNLRRSKKISRWQDILLSRFSE